MAAATTSSSRPSSTTRWGRTPTGGATRAAGSCAPSRTRCGGWAPTGSISTRSTAPIHGRTSRRRWRRSATSCARARSAPSAPRRSRASQIVEAQWIARDRHLQRFVTEQPPYSILVRAVEADVLPTCSRHGMAVMSYSPLAGGWLSGRWRKDTGQQSSSRAGRLPERFDLSSPPTSASSTPSSSSRSSPTRPGSRSSSLRSRSCSSTRRSPRRSSGRAPWSSSKVSSPPPTSPSRRRSRPHRRDRRARHDHQPGRQLVGEPGAGAGGATEIVSIRSRRARASRTARRRRLPASARRPRSARGRRVRPRRRG